MLYIPFRTDWAHVRAPSPHRISRHTMHKVVIFRPGGTTGCDQAGRARER